MTRGAVGLTLSGGRAGVSELVAKCADGVTRRDLDPPLTGRAMSSVAAEVMRDHRSRTGCACRVVLVDGRQRAGNGVA